MVGHCRLGSNAVAMLVFGLVGAVIAVGAGCGGSGPGLDTPSESDLEIETPGLGGPPKPPITLLAEARQDAAAVLPGLLNTASIRERVPFRAISWHSFQAQGVPYQIITAQHQSTTADVDLYVVGGPQAKGSAGSFELLGESCRWKSLTDWVAVEASQCTPGDLCSVAVYGYADAGGGNPCRVEYDVSLPLPEQTPTSGVIRAPFEHTWYHFSVPGDHYYRVSVMPSSGNPDLYVYADDSTGCVGQSLTYDPEEVLFWAPEEQTIFARVRAYRGAASFTVEWETADPPGPPTPAADAVEKVMLVGWDGAQRNHLEESLAAGELPNLAAMIAGGAKVDADIHGHTTDTKAGWSQILTGYPPTVTGVYNNTFYQTIPPGLTIFERAEAYYQSQSQDLNTIVVTGKARNIGSWPGLPYANAVSYIDFWAGDIRRPADQTGPIMLNCLDQYGTVGPFFAFFHFGDPDQNGHWHGENSPQYNQALITCDQWLGALMVRLQDLNIDAETRVFVVNDHGFDEAPKGHFRATDGWVVSSRPDLARDGGQEDVAPTLYAALGIPHRDLGYQPPLPGRSLMQP